MLFPVDVEGVMADTIPLFVKQPLQNFNPKSKANTKPPSDRFNGANDVQTTLHSLVLAKVSGVQTRIMIDSGAGSSYISANLLTKLNIKPCRTDCMGQWANELRYTMSMLNQMSLIVLE